MPRPVLPRGVPFLVALLLLAKLAMHLVATLVSPYEFHRDEFLYFSMGTHLRLFAMDFPPFIALLSELLRHTVGVSVPSYRIASALGGTALLLVALLLVRRLGGGRVALIVTALAILCSPLFMRTATLFQPVVWDQLWWTCALYALVRLEQTGERRWWWWLGLAGGLGLLTKFSVFFIGAGVLVGLLATPRRRDLMRPGPWIALAIALVVGSPSLVGQIALDWPLFDQMEALREGQLDRVTWGAYLGEQVLMAGPAILLALVGLWSLLAGSLARYRTVGVACLTTFLLLGALGGKAYYAGPLYPALFAAGAVALASMTHVVVRRALATVFVLASLAFGALTMPLGLPVLSPGRTARYAERLGITEATETNRGETIELPQDYADMLGWREKAEAVAAVVATLSPAERERTLLYGGNYGQAGALDLYGRRLGLPPVISLAGSFHLFGLPDRDANVIVFLGAEPEEIAPLRCGVVELRARVRHRWAVPEERDVPVVVCRDPAVRLDEVWLQMGPQWG